MNDLVIIPFLILAIIFMFYLWHYEDMMKRYTDGEIGAKEGEYVVRLQDGVYHVFYRYRAERKLPLRPFPVAMIDKGILEDMGWDTLQWAISGMKDGDEYIVRLEEDNGE